MDYAREELLRQRKALAALMTGGGTPGLEKRETFWRQTSGTNDTGGHGRENGGREPDRAASLTLNSISHSAGRALDRGEKRVENAGKAEGETLRAGEQLAGGIFSGGGNGLPGRPRKAVQTGSGGDMEGLPFETVSLWETVEERGGPVDAQAVSRAIQRDARRYDGGFSLY